MPWILLSTFAKRTIHKAFKKGINLRLDKVIVDSDKLVIFFGAVAGKFQLYKGFQVHLELMARHNIVKK